MGIFETNWGLYKLTHDRPGTPKEIKCVGCKLALGGSSFALGSLLMVVGKRKAIKNVYLGTTYGILGVGSVLISGALFRLAYENNIHNDILMKDLKKRQIENYENLKNKNLQELPA